MKYIPVVKGLKRRRRIETQENVSIATFTLKSRLQNACPCRATIYSVDRPHC